jgi:hypothetical protein
LAGFEPANFGSSASTVATTPQRRLFGGTVQFIACFQVTKVCLCTNKSLLYKMNLPIE